MPGKLNISQPRLGAPFATQKRNTNLQKLLTFNATVTGVIQETHVFVPLLCKGAEKVSTASTRMAATVLIDQVEVAVLAPYANSKGAVNMAVVKYNTPFKRKEILWMAISTSYADTGSYQVVIPYSEPCRPIQLRLMIYPNDGEGMQGGMKPDAKFVVYNLHFKPPIQPEKCVSKVLELFENANDQKDDGGLFSVQQASGFEKLLAA